MPAKRDHDIANALLAELADNNPLSDDVDFKTTSTNIRAPQTPDSPSDRDTPTPSSLPTELPHDQDASTSSSLSIKSSTDPDFLSPSRLPPSDAFFPRHKDATGSSPLSTKHPPHQAPSGSSPLVQSNQSLPPDQIDNRKPYLQPSRIGKTRLQTYVGPRAKRQVKLICINHDITEQDFLRMAINMAFAHFTVPRIAFETDQPLPSEEGHKP